VDPIDLVLDRCKIGGLIFKIDVEGYEFRVLRGMEKTLGRASCFLGIIEVAADRLAAAGDSAPELISFLNRVGIVARIGRDGRPKIIEPFWQPPQSFHGDLLIASHSDLLTRLRLSYPIRVLLGRQEPRPVDDQVY
jgi:hypothetical protein